MSVKSRNWIPGLCFWPYFYTGDESTRLSLDQLCELAKKYGTGLELVPLKDLEKVQAQGITVPAILPELTNDDPPFKTGLSADEDVYSQVVLPAYQQAINAAKPGQKVLVFAGVVKNANKSTFREIMLNRLKKLAVLAADKGVILVLEHLNSKGDSPADMKGHADYLGDDLEWVAALVRDVGSKFVKLLFDQYHVDIMHPGRLLELLKANIDIIGHIHTAGVIDGEPSRLELDGEGVAELGFFFEALTDIGYDGAVGLEYIVSPGRDPEDGIEKSLKVMGYLA